MSLNQRKGFAGSRRNSDFGAFQPGAKIVIRCSPDVLNKLPKVAGKKGVIVESPKHPNTWYTVRIENGPVIKLRKSALQAAEEYEESISSATSNAPGYENSYHNRSTSTEGVIEEDLLGKLVSIESGRYKGRFGTVANPSSVKGYWCVKIHEESDDIDGSDVEGEGPIIVKRTSELQVMSNNRNPEVKVIYNAAAILVQLMNAGNTRRSLYKKSQVSDPESSSEPVSECSSPALSGAVSPSPGQPSLKRKRDVWNENLIEEGLRKKLRIANPLLLPESTLEGTRVHLAHDGSMSKDTGNFISSSPVIQSTEMIAAEGQM